MVNSTLHANSVLSGNGGGIAIVDAAVASLSGCSFVYVYIRPCYWLEQHKGIDPLIGRLVCQCERGAERWWRYGGEHRHVITLRLLVPDKYCHLPWRRHHGFVDCHCATASNKFPVRPPRTQTNTPELLKGNAH